MTILSVSGFSCLKEAEFELAPINVIIGPQGSGKSVTTKLLYFFADIVSGYVQSAERGDSVEDYKRQLARQFSLWFPPSAWGSGRFNINYSAGAFWVRALRRMSGGRPSDDLSLTFSDWFTDVYKSTSELFEKSRAGNDLDNDPNLQVNVALEQMWRIRDFAARRLANELGNEYLPQQTFIPAGRAFFTSIGRMVAGFEQAGNLDPITIKFARLFAGLRERESRRILSSRRLNRLGTDFIERRNLFMTRLFGGEIKFEDETEFVEAEDGRKIPFSSLSSGQQELLPMWTLLDYFNEQDAIRSGGLSRLARSYRELIYIEEPEAHLFPSAQSLLMEFLISSIIVGQTKRSLIITTHSPYIMSKLNVFLKAGHLARRKKRNHEINEIVSRDCWLGEKQLAAFAIENGHLRNLMDEDGLIDGRYLDGISEEISSQFSRLLRIESEL